MTGATLFAEHGTFESLRDGFWTRPDGATIKKVSPRGQTFYALRLSGSRRPDWFDSLDDAKRAAQA